jgi:hypothetical protein
VKTNFESLNLALVRDEFNADMFDENLDNEQHIEEMMNRQAARAMKKTCNLHLTQLPMYRSAQVVKAMRQNMPPQRLLCVMSRHQVTLSGGHITRTKS